MSKKKIYVLTYHSVDDIGYLHSIHKKDFEKQIKYLSNKFQTLSYKSFCDIVSGKELLEKDGVLITFDDGVQDNYINALPILRKYNVPAVIFLTTGHVGKVHGGKRGYKFKFLEWSEMREMVDSGLVSIQNHTHTHPLLTEISDFSVKDEIVRSNSLINIELSEYPTAIAYPKGDYNDGVKKIVKDYFDYGFIVGGGYWTSDNKDLYEIPRILISQEVSSLKFKILLSEYFWFFRNLYYELKLFLNKRKSGSAS